VLHADLTGGKRKRPSIVTRCFQGELEVTTLAGTGALGQSYRNSSPCGGYGGPREAALASTECDDVPQQSLQTATVTALVAAWTKLHVRSMPQNRPAISKSAWRSTRLPHAGKVPDVKLTAKVACVKLRQGGDAGPGDRAAARRGGARAVPEPGPGPAASAAVQGRHGEEHHPAGAWPSHSLSLTLRYDEESYGMQWQEVSRVDRTQDQQDVSQVLFRLGEWQPEAAAGSLGRSALTTRSAGAGAHLRDLEEVRRCQDT